MHNETHVRQYADDVQLMPMWRRALCITVSVPLIWFAYKLTAGQLLYSFFSIRGTLVAGMLGFVGLGLLLTAVFPHGITRR